MRFYLIGTHYRSPLDFDDEKLAAAARGLERLRTSLRLLEEALAKSALYAGSALEEVVPDPEFANRLETLRGEFEAAMDDDFNTALAVGTMFDLAREINSFLQKQDRVDTPAGIAALQKAKELFYAFNGVLGVLKTDDKGSILLDAPEGEDESLVDKLVQLVIDIRQEARKKKDWATADSIRDRLKELGIVLEDTPSGVRWKKQG